MAEPVIGDIEAVPGFDGRFRHSVERPEPFVGVRSRGEKDQNGYRGGQRVTPQCASHVSSPLSVVAESWAPIPKAPNAGAVLGTPRSGSLREPLLPPRRSPRPASCGPGAAGGAVP